MRSNRKSAEDKWYESRYTGIFTNFGRLNARPHDPEVSMWAGSVVPCGPRDRTFAIGGAGWTDRAAQMACIGEAVERFQTYPLPQDQSIETSLRNWPIDEPALGPENWVLFHPEQYRRSGFPFLPFTEDTVCRW